MPYQNRVTPFGSIIAAPAKGSLMGNRGCLHDTGDHPLRQYQGRRWIICVLDFKGRKKAPMPPGHYTSLFFLDEATGLAAGHRPCAECQRERFNLFCLHWAAANLDLAERSAPSVDLIDSTLHRERISMDHYHRDKVKLKYVDRLETLPDGAFVVLPTSDSAYLVYGDALFPWKPEGYGPPLRRPTTMVEVLTPRSTVLALVHGYQPAISFVAAPLTS